MTTPTFPSYATLLLSGFSESRGASVIRTNMENGLPKQAKVRSRAMTTRTCRIQVLTRADYLAFVEWYSSELSEGALWFHWFDPVRRVTKLCRFVADSDLVFAPAGDIEGIWTASVKVESL